MKILMLTTSFPTSSKNQEGIFILELAQKLKDKFEIVILTPHCYGSKKFEIINNIKVYRFQYFWPQHWQQLCYKGGILPNIKKNPLLLFQVPFLLLFEFFALIKIIKKESINLIHAHWIIPQGFISYIIYKLYKIPYIITSHGSDIAGVTGFKSIKKIVLKNAQKITVVSQFLKNEILNTIDSTLKDKISILPMGVDFKLFEKGKYSKNLKIKYHINGPFLLYVGRLSPEKGVKFLILAMKTIIKKFNNAKLIIVGDGSLKKDLVNLTKELDLNKNIIFTGQIPKSELPKFYATADVFIGPSLREGLGLTFIESIVCDCPVIGTKVGGIPDIIEDNKTGLLVQPKNPNEIANAVIKILKNTQLKQNFIKNAKNKIKKYYSWETTIGKFEYIYNYLKS